MNSKKCHMHLNQKRWCAWHPHKYQRWGAYHLTSTNRLVEKKGTEKSKRIGNTKMAIGKFLVHQTFGNS